MDAETILDFITSHPEGHEVYKELHVLLYSIEKICRRHLGEGYIYAGFSYYDNSIISNELLDGTAKHINNDAFCIVGTCDDPHKRFNVRVAWVNRWDFIEEIQKELSEPSD